MVDKEGKEPRSIQRGTLILSNASFAVAQTCRNEKPKVHVQSAGSLQSRPIEELLIRSQLEVIQLQKMKSEHASTKNVVGYLPFICLGKRETKLLPKFQDIKCKKVRNPAAPIGFPLRSSTQFICALPPSAEI